ncbi:uncharacterized protein LOC116619738 [Nematostella vectensis]|uniref:uncharacterized protein LOC116619738 n=1 Tax=Nematostella vectensis TaxID=45351 RepID=UPI0013901AC8|nr:uncharacterized protein LOC116619738 [Nematostella vectensis]XP_032240715.1 uncharacterized protein LOC116619738 [Nematostella vectensis]XP_048585342.1 uncharacterized protein LOC116619738 [Nematostella vectensis]XP_048585343.1 uncharacterized protein LOC116619738 [Nematostella vectensis]XP_048585344.1 uncharacterized protein LOC116619738 [Nematostella vectensis]
MQATLHLLLLFVVVASIEKVNAAPQAKWSTWTVCSASCGSSGVQSRNQFCPSGKCEPPVPDPPPSETRECNRNPCNPPTTLGTDHTTPSNTTGNRTKVPTTPRTSEGETPTSLANAPSKMSSTEARATEAKKILAPGEEDVADGTMTVDQEYNPKLQDKTSKEFKELQHISSKLLDDALSELEDYLRNEIIEFLKGSVVIRYRIYTRKSSGYTSNRLSNTLSNSISSGRVSSPLKVTSVTVNLMSTEQEGETESKKVVIVGEPIEVYWFFLFGMGAMTIMAIVFIGIRILKGKIMEMVPKPKERVQAWEESSKVQAFGCGDEKGHKF